MFYKVVDKCVSFNLQFEWTQLDFCSQSYGQNTKAGSENRKRTSSGFRAQFRGTSAQNQVFEYS